MDAPLAPALRSPCAIAAAETAQTRPMVLDNVRIIDGSGGAPIENGRIVIDGDRIVRVGPAAAIGVPAGAETVDLSGRTVIPGLIDSHFHIENDPKLALRQLSHGVTAFRDPGQWDEKFDELRRMIAADGIARAAHLHDGAAHRRRESRLSGRLRRRAGCGGSAAARRAVRRAAARPR